jgi:acyl carrier protein
MPAEEYRIARELLPLPSSFVAPRTVTEQRLAAIWQDVLSMDRVGVDDSYDELGGDSLHAAIIFTRIEDVFAIWLPMATLVDNPTIARLAVEIERQVTG